MPKMAAPNHSRFTPPAKAMPTKIPTKIRETPASPEMTQFRPATITRWATISMTELILDSLFCRLTMTEAMIRM